MPGSDPVQAFLNGSSVAHTEPSLEERAERATDLGNVLIMNRSTTPEAVTVACKQQSRSGRHLGTELLGMEAITPRDLAAGLIRQARLRGTTLDVVGVARTIANALGVYHLRVQNRQEDLRAVLEQK